MEENQIVIEPIENGYTITWWLGGAGTTTTYCSNYQKLTDILEAHLRNINEYWLLNTSWTEKNDV